MSIISTMLPILILIVIILLFAGIGSYFYKIGKKFFTVKFTHWMLGIYLIVLLVATAIVPFMSETKGIVEKATQQEQDEILNELYTHLHDGEIESIRDQYLAIEQTFEHDLKNPLHIQSALNDFGISVFIEKKQESDNTIEAFVYRSALTYNELDFSDILEPYKLEKTDNSLDILAPIQDIHVSIIGPTFPVRQLTEQSIISHSSSGAEGLVYLRVPSEIKITNDENVFLNFVKK